MSTNRGAPAETIDSPMRAPGFAEYQGRGYQGIINIVLGPRFARRSTSSASAISCFGTARIFRTNCSKPLGLGSDFAIQTDVEKSERVTL